MKKYAFTLVELIVVITILAILGTITFVSLSGYSKEARDTKRITDVRSLLNKVTIENIKGIQLKDLIVNTTPATGQILGIKNTTFQTMGEANFETLKENKSSFQDPSVKRNYPVAYAVGGNGTGAYNFVQIATVSEKDNTTKLLGNYYANTAGDIPSLFTEDGINYYEEGNTPIYNVSALGKEDIVLVCPKNPTLEEYFYFEINKDGKTGTITGYSEDGPKDVIIPCEIDGVRVTSIRGSDGEFGDAKHITSVEIPNSVTNIGDLAFASNQLTSVEIPDSVTSIGGNAFASNQLTSVEIPNSVTSIGNYAFESNQLMNIKMPSSLKSVGKGIFDNNPLTSITNYDGGVSNEYVYLPYEGGIEINKYFGSNKNVSIPETINGKIVKSIGNDIFNGEYAQYGIGIKLTSVIIPNSVTNIGEGAFLSNELTSVTIPDSVTNIGELAFSANKLTSVVIGDSVTSIGEWAFDYQTNSLGNGTIYGPQSLRDTYYNSTYFDTAKLTQWVVQ